MKKIYFAMSEMHLPIHPPTVNDWDCHTDLVKLNYETNF